MIGERLIWDNLVNEVVPRHEYDARRVETKRSGLHAPMVISDVMPATEHPLTGKFIDSKSGFEAVTRAHGYTTMGNDPARLRPSRKPKPDRKSIRASLEKAAARARA